MRITNRMITNNSLNNINKNKNLMNKYDEQYSTGKKIQRPSDDPIVAVRALKLRTTVSELTQYLKKNVPDAKSWMEVTESAMKNINTIVTNINTQFNQGSNDPLSKSDRESIVKNLTEMKKQILSEGNASYAGRYVFSGYKTDKSLLFNKAYSDTKYNISEEFGGADIGTISKVVGEYELSDYTGTAADNFGDAPTVEQSYRIRLSYANLDSVNAVITYIDPATNLPVTINPAMTTSTADYAYTVPTPANGGNPAGTEDAKFLTDTGELILSAATYNTLRQLPKGSISISYEKTNFSEGDLRPEHYFDCVATTPSTSTNPNDSVTYVSDKQNIDYEISFNQKITVNTEGKDVITHSMGRDIDEVLEAANDVDLTEKKIAEVDKLLNNPDTTDAQKVKLNQLKGQLETALVLKNTVLQKKFSAGITQSTEYQNKLNNSIADAGSRYKRLELAEDRLDTQLVDMTELMSNNEDADLAEVIINFTSADAIYNASLNAASKIVKNTLLDFI